MKKYFINGFNLAKKNIDLLIIDLALSIFIQLTSPITLLISSVGSIIGIGFTLSFPLFLINRQRNKTISYKQIAEITLRNSFRSFLPILLLGIPLFLLIGVPLAYFYFYDNQIAIQIINSIIVIVTIVSIGINSFTSIYFSIENQNLVKAFINSFQTSFKNIKFVILVLLMGSITPLLYSIFPKPELFKAILFSFISSSIYIVLVSSALYYYQDRIKK